MKILLLSCADSIHTVKWANAFVNDGHEVLLISNTGHEAKDSYDTRVNIKYLRHSGVKGYYLNVRELRNIYITYKPDIVNVHYASGYGTLARLAKIKPYVLSVWGSDVYVFPKKSFIHRHILRKNVKYATAIASTSNSMLNELKKVVNISSSETIVTPFGIDVDFFSPNGDSIKVASDKFVFGLIKKLTPIYGIEYLIRAFKIVHDYWLNNKKNLEPFLFICGNGDQKEYYEKLLLDLELENCSKISGYISHDKIPSILRGIDVFCLSSLSESFGVSALEAMACEKPVIATDADGFKEIIDNDYSGIIVKKASVQEFADKMIFLYNDSSKRICYGKNARSVVLTNYDWKKNSKLLIDFLSKHSGKK